MKFSVTLLILVACMNVHAQNDRPEIHCKHFLFGYPYGTPASNDLIIRDIYALSNNDSTKFADWVAYRLTMHEVDGDLSVERDWTPDPWLDPSETLEPRPDDYTRANRRLKTDRGHQAPLASFKGSRHASHTNYLSNITPQKSDLNQGPWKDLEEDVRDLVRTGQTVYVMTGPLYERQMDPLPEADENHVVPSGFWKIIAIQEGSVLKVASFIFDQETPRSDDVIDHLSNVDTIEMRSGLDFFWDLDDARENSLEASVDTNFANTHFGP